MSGQLIDAVYMTLKQDEEFMSMIGLATSSTQEEVTQKIVRGMEPEQALTGDSVPQALIYIKPGRYSRNDQVYEGKFCIDLYAKNTAQARGLAQRIFELIHDREIAGPGFYSFRAFLAYDADFATGITGVKGYCVMYDVDYIRAN
ncbi:hypothetical protein [Cohnella sp.]|uniref:hypothetical protein n=1 Tax=Cohnella sp. TaxID=1883426 RepID=UPI003704CD0E